MTQTNARTDFGFTHIWRPPAGGDARTLLLLHGTGGDEQDLVHLADLLAPGLGVLSPRGKVLEQGMPRFFRRLGPGVFDEEDLKVRTHELSEFVTAAAKAYRFDAARVIAVGFSNGANIAAAMLLLGSPAPAAAVLLRAMVPLTPPKLPDLTGRRVLIAAGRRDAMTAADQPAKLESLLREAGADVETHWSMAGHELAETDILAASSFIAGIE